MKFRRLIFLLIISVLGICVVGCTGDKEPAKTPTPVDSTEIADKDKVKPSSSNLDYTDYGLLGDGEKMPDYDTSKWYRNDLTVPLPDPHVYYEDGVYYIYGTTDRTGAQSFDCYATTDFINYEKHLDIFRPNSANNPSEWEGNVLFAPEMYKFGDYYYLYYSNVMRGNNERYLHAVRGTSPIGPFEQIVGENGYGEHVDGSKSPLFPTPNGGNVLDMTVFVDDDEQMYMFYVISTSTQHIEGCKMLDPITVDWSTNKSLIVPGELNTKTDADTLFWEAYNGYNIAEGPYLLKSPNGLYYMTYSVNDYQNRYYSICYAFSDEPLGDYAKPYTVEQKANGEIWTNLLLGYAGGKSGTVYDQWTGFSSGNGHHSFFYAGDQLMIAYHQHKNRNTSGSGRGVAFDYVHFDENGDPYTDGPTWSLQPLPEAVSGYKNIALNAKVKSFNVENAHFVNDNYVVRHYNLKQEEGKEVILKPGKAYIELVFDKEYYVGGIMVNNSAYYEKALSEIEFINFFNGNAAYNISFMLNYLKDEKEFIFPGSSFTIDFEDIKTNRVLLCFDTSEGGQINEIQVLGKEVKE